MKHLVIGLLGCFLLMSVHVEAAPPMQIQFEKGAVCATWKGVIKDGNKKFKIHLGKGQSFKVGGEDVYTWHLITSKGTKLGCNGGEYCPPEEAISPLPYSGIYIVNTDYRMSNCADCPSSKTRKVTVTFEAK